MKDNETKQHRSCYLAEGPKVLEDNVIVQQFKHMFYLVSDIKNR